MIKVQKRALGVITFSPYLEESLPLFKDLQIPTIRQQYFINICVLVYKELNGITLRTFKFKRAPQTYCTWRNNKKRMQKPFCKTNYGNQSIAHTGPSFYDVLDDNISNKQNHHSFRRNLRKMSIARLTDLNVENLIY